MVRSALPSRREQQASQHMVRASQRGQQAILRREGARQRVGQAMQSGLLWDSVVGES